MAVADLQNIMSFCDIIMNTYEKFFNPKNPRVMHTQNWLDPAIWDPEIAIPIPVIQPTASKH